MREIVIGIDVGASGGIVILGDGIIESYKTPITIQDHLEFFSDYTDENVRCVVEKVGGRFGDAAFSAFNFGFTCGIMHAALTACQIQFTDVHPKTWQKYYGMSKDKGESVTSWKNRLKMKAQSLYPHHKATLWSADAVLIAHYHKHNK